MNALRLVDGLLWALRREGLVVAPSSAVDAVRAVVAVGFDDRARLADALAAVVVKRAADRARFDDAFARYFAAERPRTLAERLEAEGLSPHEAAAVHALLAERATLRASLDLEALVPRFGEERTRRLLATVGGELQAGLYAHRLAAALGVADAPADVEALRPLLRAALGGVRGDAATSAALALAREAERVVRAHVVDEIRRRAPSARGAPASPMAVPLADLGADDARAVRLGLRRFVERLRGETRVRRRRAARAGRLAPAATLRAALRTGGVPLRLVRRARRVAPRRLYVLCDVSDSVRASARFLLELTAAVHDLVPGARTFVFVRRLAETTARFEADGADEALRAIATGAVVPLGDGSSYGAALRDFERAVGRALDRRATIVILGDARSNFGDDGAAVLARLAARARDVFFLATEARAAWGTGDSRLARYAPHVTDVLEVRTAEDLVRAARVVFTTRRAGA